jgi:hypothetical protein
MSPDLSDSGARTNQDASLTVLELLFAWITDSGAVTGALNAPSQLTVDLGANGSNALTDSPVTRR